MPIESSKVINVRRQPNGSVRVYAEHTDQTGEIHPQHSRVGWQGSEEATDVMVAQVVGDYAIRTNDDLLNWEDRAVCKFIREGGSPGEWTRQHTTPIRFIKQVLRAFMEEKDLHQALSLATWIQATLTANQIESATSVAIRTKIVAKAVNLISMGPSLAVDSSNTEEISV